MGLITRQIGVDAKGSKLTFAEMDNNLYYLQSLGVSGLTYTASTLTLTNPTGGTLSVNIANDTNTFITATTYNDLTNTITLTDNTDTNFNTYINAFSGLTVNGNVGIGITSPSTKLHVSQGMSIFDTLSSGQKTIAKFTNSNGANIRIGHQSTSIPIISYENFGLRFGTSFSDNNAISNTALVLTSDSSVGIGGIINPTEKLHVSGNALITGSLTADTVSATTISADTLYGDGSNLTGISTEDIFVTGGTYSTGTISLLRNDGNFVNITGVTNYPIYVTGNTVSFDSQYFYNSRTSPGTGNITEDLTDAKLGVVQKIYHNDVSLPSFPSGWILVGSGTYTIGVLNIIMCEWIGGTSVEYWILQDQ